LKSITRINIISLDAPALPMEADWTEKYRPTSLDQLYGNGKAIRMLQAWASSWTSSMPGKKAVILAGSPGTGKTSAALALAYDMDWGVIELNASDVRNADNINSIATRGALFETFTDSGEFIKAREGGRKIIILDEADNLYERVSSRNAIGGDGRDYSDRGGKSAIVQTIKRTQQPIVLIVNDLYALTKNSTLKKLCQILRFQKIHIASIEKALTRIIRMEGLEVEMEALEIIATRADGDLRAAINDLQALSKLGKRITVETTDGIGFRDNVITMQEALEKIFKGTDVNVRKVAWDLDETPDSLLTWLDENLPHEYKDPLDLMKGYDALSRADVYLGRVRKRQYYRLWAYANDMMTAGVALAKDREYRHFTKYHFPGWILKMSRTKGMRKSRNELSGKIGALCHTSIRDARMELLPVIQLLFKDSENRDFDFAVSMTDKLALEPGEIAFLLGTIPEDPRVGLVKERAVALHGRRTGFMPSMMDTKKGMASGLEKRKARKPKKTAGKKKKDKDSGKADNKIDKSEMGKKMDEGGRVGKEVVNKDHVEHDGTGKMKKMDNNEVGGKMVEGGRMGKGVVNKDHVEHDGTGKMKKMDNNEVGGKMVEGGRVGKEVVNKDHVEHDGTGKMKKLDNGERVAKKADGGPKEEEVVEDPRGMDLKIMTKKESTGGEGDDDRKDRIRKKKVKKEQEDRPERAWF